MAKIDPNASSPNRIRRNFQKIAAGAGGPITVDPVTGIASFTSLGVKENLVGHIYAMSADGPTVTNTAANTSYIIEKGFTFPAGFLTPGRMIRGTTVGKTSCTSFNPVNVTFTWDVQLTDPLGNTAGFLFPSNSYNSEFVSGARFAANFTGIVRGTGAGATLSRMGNAFLENQLNPTANYFVNVAGTAAFNANLPQNVQVLVSWNCNSTGVNTVSGISTISGALVTTTAPHGFSPGQTVLISGVTSTGYNTSGSTIVAVSPTTFVYSVGAGLTSPAALAATGAIATVTGIGTIPIANIISNPVAVATTSTQTGFYVGQTVTIAGASPSGYNGAFTVTGTVVSNGTFTFAVGSLLGAASGTITATPSDPPVSTAFLQQLSLEVG